MAEPEQNWRSKWDEECPLTIGVALQNWESWSDSALRDELKRIRETGFQTVRVTFSRDTDIEKSPGMMNWRNPDRFFDAAEQAGLKIWCAPGNLPHASMGYKDDAHEWEPRALADTIKWVQRFCRQYQNHPALLAWILELEFVSWVVQKPNLPPHTNNDQTAPRALDILKAFQDTDPQHPVLAHQYYTDHAARYRLNGVGSDASSVVFNIYGFLETNEVEGGRELDRPFYAKIKLETDCDAPSLAVLYDCTGGSTHGFPWHPFTMTTGKMTRMLLLALAAGIKSVCFDKWMASTTKPFVGESGLVDWLGRVTPSALIAGRIGQAVEPYRQEVWHSQTIPNVHILYSLNSPAESRSGAVRTLLNGNIPFAFVTDTQLLEDKPDAPAILVVPGFQVLSEPLLTKLTTLAEAGMRVITDLYFDFGNTHFKQDNGDLLNTRPGSPFEQLFGASIAGMFYKEYSDVEDKDIPSLLRAQIVTTTARAGGGEGEVPAFTENRVGKGRALLINLPLSRIIADTRLPNAQLSLLSYILGSRQTELPGLTGCLQFRRTSQNAEHIFLINDSAEDRTVSVSAPASYTQATDVLADAALIIAEGSVSITVPAGSGSWLRLS